MHGRGRVTMEGEGGGIGGGGFSEVPGMRRQVGFNMTGGIFRGVV